MDIILNEITETVHKHEQGASDLHTECGVTYNLSPDQLQKISVGEVVVEHSANKCGRCFDDGGGY